MQYIRQGRLGGTENGYIIAEHTDSGKLIAYYKGYYNHKFRRYTLYPDKRVNTLADNFTKKSVSSFDVRYA